MANPLRAIAKLSAGDFVAKALYFLTFVYLARALDVDGYGLLEFANALFAYALLVADAGLEAWGIRQVAQAGNVRELAGRVTALRLAFSALAFLLLLGTMPFLASGLLRILLGLLGLSLFPQAANLKWIFMGEQKMGPVARGLMLAQVVFAVSVFAIVRNPAGLLWVPVLKLLSDGVAAAYFGWRFVRAHRPEQLWPRQFATGAILASALPIGAQSALSMINYNFDSVMLGFFAGATAVGWYSAAYKPVTVALAMPMTWFTGLYPALAGSYGRDPAEFRRTVEHSLRLLAALAVPLGVGGAMLAPEIVVLLFGPAYAPSIPVLQVLVWSAALVMLRGTFSYSLMAANQTGPLLRCAIASAVTNVVLNALLIPRYGMLGATAATIVAEFVWLALVVQRVKRHVVDVSLLVHLVRPAAAGIVMALVLRLAQPLFWMLQATVAVSAYFVVLVSIGGISVREFRRGE